MFNIIYFFATSKFWDVVKNIFIWLFDESCDPDKFSWITNLFM